MVIADRPLRTSSSPSAPRVKELLPASIPPRVVSDEQISPELALVDPDLRARALEDLLRIESSRLWAPFAPVRLSRPEIQLPVQRRSAPFLVALGVYLGFGLVQVAVWGLVLMAALAASIAATVLFL